MYLTARQVVTTASLDLNAAASSQTAVVQGRVAAVCSTVRDSENWTEYHPCIQSIPIFNVPHCNTASTTRLEAAEQSDSNLYFGTASTTLSLHYPTTSFFVIINHISQN